jgi:hypothetical protein
MFDNSIRKESMEHVYKAFVESFVYLSMGAVTIIGATSSVINA